LIGVGVAVRRKWVRMPRPDETVNLMWCGGQLFQNPPMAEQGWRRFIDTLVAVNTH